MEGEWEDVGRGWRRMRKEGKEGVGGGRAGRGGLIGSRGGGTRQGRKSKRVESEGRGK